MKAFILLGIILSSMQYAIADESKSLTGLFKLNNSKVSGELNKANVFGLSLYLDFKHQFNNYLGVKTIGGVSLETGESKKGYGDRSFKPSNSLSLKHAALEIKPVDFLKIELGALNQGYHNNPLFLTSTAFVAAREVFSYKINQWTFQLDMIQAIPTNSSLSQRIGSVDEGSSRFFNEKIRVIGEGDAIDLEASVGLFAFDELNSSIAYNSRLLGNSVSGVGTVNNKFEQNYKGQNADLKVNYKNFNLLNISFEAAYHINQNASEGKGVGYIVGPLLTSKTFENKYSLRIKTYKNEADSTVAYYSSKFTGQTNRKGFLAGFSVENKKMDLEYGVDTYFSNPISKNSFQDEEKIINFSLRKSYDFL